MFRQILLISAIVATLVVLLSPSLMAQSQSDGDRLFNEALQLLQKAGSNEDLKKAVPEVRRGVGHIQKCWRRKGRSLYPEQPGQHLRPEGGIRKGRRKFHERYDHIPGNWDSRRLAQKLDGQSLSGYG